MKWIISANSQLYDHALSFAHYGSIDWKQGKNRFNTNDTIYIYCSAPLKRIRYKCIVTATDLTSDLIRDDQKYWLDKERYHESLSGKFFNLKLIEEIDSESLNLEALLKNGLQAAPQAPIKVKENLATYIENIFSKDTENYFPDTVNEDELLEGLTKQVFVNRYERSPIARQKCIEKHGSHCHVCLIDFFEQYGEIGKGFIHVHHVTPIHQIKQEYKIDYVNDLIPVCPNCHAMLHRKIHGRNLTTDELRQAVKNKISST